MARIHSLNYKRNVNYFTHGNPESNWPHVLNTVGIGKGVVFPSYPALPVGSTFSRATTGTEADFEGLVRTANVNEARFPLARRVENLFPNSNNLTLNPSSIGNGSGTVVVSPNNIHFGATAGDYIYLKSITYPASTMMVSRIALSGTGSIRLAISQRDSNAPNPITILLTSTPVIYSIYATNGVGTDNGFTGLFLQSNGAVSDIVINYWQIEDTKGQLIIAPGNYVSKGVLPSYPYHGAGVDGVRYFNTANGNTVLNNVVTDAPGAPLPGPFPLLVEGARTNLIRYSTDVKTGSAGTIQNQSAIWNAGGTGPELVTNGTFLTDATGWTALNATLSVTAGELVVTNTAADGRALQTISGLVVGNTYQFSFRARNGTANQAYAMLGSSSGASDYYLNSIVTGASFTISTSFVAIGTSCFIALMSTGATGNAAIFDTASMRLAQVQIGTPLVISPNGLPASYTLMAAAADSLLIQSFTGTAAAYSSSVYLKRKTGTGVVSLSTNGTVFTPCVINNTTWTRCFDSATLTAAAYNLTLKLATLGDEVYVWNFGEELGNPASTSIPTLATTVTRAADLYTP